MECRLVQAHLGDLIDGSLDEPLRTQIENHLLGCSRCRLEKQRLLKTVTALRAVDTLELPSDFVDNLWRRIDQFETAKRGFVLVALLSLMRRYRKSIISSAIAFVLAFGGTAYLLKHSGGVEPGTGRDIAREVSPGGVYVMKDIVHGVGSDTSYAAFPRRDSLYSLPPTFQRYYVDEVRPVSTVLEPF